MTYIHLFAAISNPSRVEDIEDSEHTLWLPPLHPSRVEDIEDSEHAFWPSFLCPGRIEDIEDFERVLSMSRNYLQRFGVDCRSPSAKKLARIQQTVLEKGYMVCAIA